MVGGAAIAVAVLALLWGMGRVGIRLREPDMLEASAARAPGSFVTVDGHRVHLVDRGAGPALLLIHGFGGSTFDWEQHVLAPLTRSHRVIAVDLWGMGFSERRDDVEPDFATFAEQLVGVLDGLGVERASVAGHSMGGAVSAVLAARHPERIERLVLIAGLAPMERGETPWIFVMMRTPIAGEIGLALTDNLAPPFAPQDYLERMARVSRIRGSRQALLRYVRRQNKFEALQAAYPVIAAPTLIVHGTADASVPFAAAQRAAALIRNARLIPLEGRGHWLLWEAPEQVVEEIDRFTAPQSQ
jgi:pimeloyl-ACP methyl ester carboxylesterase